jgi:hypothetical protein
MAPVLRPLKVGKTRLNSRPVIFYSVIIDDYGKNHFTSFIHLGRTTKNQALSPNTVQIRCHSLAKNERRLLLLMVMSAKCVE